MELNDLIKTADDRQLLYVATFNGVMRVESARDNEIDVMRAVMWAGQIPIFGDDKAVAEVWKDLKFYAEDKKTEVKVEIVECALVRANHDQMEVKA